MAREIEQSMLPDYTGKFAWSTKELCAFIKAVKPDYDRFDPKTWPVITSKHLEQQIGYTYTGASLLPPYVAYERKLVDDCVALRNDEHIKVEMVNGSVKNCDFFFHHFPFVFDSLGRSRPFECMRADDYVAWVQSMTGTSPKTRTKEKNPSSQIDVYDEILEMIRESPSNVDAKEVDNLKQALAAAQLELAKQIARADTAEKAMVDNKNIYERDLAKVRRRTEAVAQSSKNVKEALQKSLTEKSAMLAASQADFDRCQRLNAVRLAENKRATMELASEKERVNKEMEMKDKELQAARAETTVAKEQIRNIRDEMKKAKEMKREASCDLSNERKKRVKVEK